MPPKRGKLQSPFTGRYEPVNPEQPVLYARYTRADDIVQTPVANGASSKPAKDTPGVPSAKKRRKLQAPQSSTTPAEPAAAPEPAPLPKEYNNKEQAQSIRSTLGTAYSGPEAKTGAPAPAAGQFSFGFQVSQGSVAPAALNLEGFPDAEAGAQLPKPSKKSKKKRKAEAKAETAPEAAAQLATPEPGAAAPSGPGQASENGHAAATAPTTPFVPRRVFVGGMPFSMEEEDVRGFWEECGEVAEVDLMRFPDTGRFKGIAFITFGTEEGYTSALSCDGETHNDVRLKVEPCRSGGLKRPPKGQAATGAAAGATAAAAAEPAPKPEGAAPKTSGYLVAYVGNIAFTVTAKQLETALEGCSVNKVRLHTDPNTHRSKGFAHVHFEDEDSLDRAVELDGLTLSGRELRIGYAQPKKGK